MTHRGRLRPQIHKILPSYFGANEPNDSHGAKQFGNAVYRIFTDDLTKGQ